MKPCTVTHQVKSMTMLLLLAFLPFLDCARDRVARRRPPSTPPSLLPIASAGLIAANDHVAVNRIRETAAAAALGGASSSDAGVVFPKNKLKAGSSLEAKLVSLANVTKAEDFFRILGVSLPTDLQPVPKTPLTDLEDIDSLERKRQRPTRQSFVNQAACEPEMRTIDLSEYTHTSVDQDVAVFPRCIRVPRCGGCCGPSDLLQCLPTRVTLREVTRVLQRLTVTSKDSKNTIQETVQVEYHEQCACQCRVQEKDCDPSKHQYHADKCKCMCVNSREQQQCLADPVKYWNPSDCSCMCRNPKRCSTGLRFSHDSCACEIEQPNAK